ncbi:MAG TPA: hypothetical protein VIH71_15610 [Solirubrobacteraceae bacterium]
MSHRPLVLLSGLTLGDYLLWSWSLNSNHDVLALVAGLTLPPLAVACIWLLALSVARVLANTARRPRRRVRHRHTGRRRAIRPPATAAVGPEASTAATAADRSSRKLAA